MNDFLIVLDPGPCHGDLDVVQRYYYEICNTVRRSNHLSVGAAEFVRRPRDLIRREEVSRSSDVWH
jgi:hypothetical protein